MKTSGSIFVDDSLKKLGNDIKKARLRRNIGAALFSERVGVSRSTLSRLESGDSSVGIGSYARALDCLDKLEEFTNLIDLKNDRLGQLLVDKALPERIRNRGARV